MSVKYVPVQWNSNKIFYDAVLLACICLYIWIYLHFGNQYADNSRPVSPATLRIRAFGSCAFLMLSVILCIGPLARLDRRFLPLLYNRRHFGVLTALVALTHAIYVLDWYFAFSPMPPFEALLSANTNYDRLLGFPFESLGIVGLVILLILAATSHDFWLSFLSAPIWKRLHLLIYVAYAAVVGHIALGALQQTDNLAFALIAGVAALAVSSVHVAAAVKQGERPMRAAGNWIPVAKRDAFIEGRAIIVPLRGNERAAVFCHQSKLSAVSNACAHQNGPLGEGRIFNGCITCPWHGFQYKLEDGCAPAPFTEKIPTYRLRLENDTVLLNPVANPPGTYVPPLELDGQQT